MRERVWSAVVVLLVFCGCSLCARDAARGFYDEYWPGVPDQFRAETALLPWLSFRYYEYFFWEDGRQALIFLSACCVFVIPPLAAMPLARGKHAVMLVVAATCLIAFLALYDLCRRWGSYMELFGDPTRTSVFDLLRATWRSSAWVLGLSVGGLAGGFVFRWMSRRRRFPEGCCRACGYDLRTQVALQLNRCPECGRRFERGS